MNMQVTFASKAKVGKGSEKERKHARMDNGCYITHL